MGSVEDPPTEAEARALLSGVELVGRIASDVSISALSGGQKVRLALAKLIRLPPHLLVLDEVTTHLDADTITALAGFLRGYQGALLVVTHDRFFMRCVVEGESPYAGKEDEDDDRDDGSEDEEEAIPPGVVYHLAKGRLENLGGGMNEYEGIAEKSILKGP